MDVGLVINNPIGQAAANAAALPRSVDSGFATTMASQLDNGASTVERAEQLIGARIRAPEGGCGCDAFVNAVAPSAPEPQVIDRAPDRGGLGQATQLQMPTFTLPQGQNVSPGEVLTLDDPADLSGHLHRAILRNATEMITANQSGLVEVLSIPWDQVQRR